MRNLFADTSNTEAFSDLCYSLEHRDQGTPGLGLVHGDPGLGKTRTGIREADKTGAVFIRALASATLRSFLEDLVIELNQEPMFRTSDLYRQAERELSMNPRLVIVDEIDRLASSWQTIEVLRDLTDQTGIPILMIGMDTSERKLARFRHIFYRMKSHILRFTPLSEPDVRRFSDQICEIPLDDSAIHEIHQVTGGRIGDIISELYKAERIARANEYATIEAKHLIRRAA